MKASPAVASSPGRFSTASSDGKDSDTEVDFSKFKSNRKGDAPDGQVNKNRPPQKPFTPPRPGKKLQVMFYHGRLLRCRKGWTTSEDLCTFSPFFGGVNRCSASSRN